MSDPVHIPASHACDINFGNIDAIPVGDIVTTECPTCHIVVEGTRDFNGIGAVRLVVKTPWVPITESGDMRSMTVQGLPTKMTVKVKVRRGLFTRKPRHD